MGAAAEQDRRLVVALDHGRAMGALAGIEDPGRVIETVLDAGADALLISFGLLKRYRERLEGRVPRVVRISERRYSFELPLDPPPDRVLAELTAAGAALVSLNPIRETLEDFFVQQVTSPDALAHDRGLGSAPLAGGRP